MNGERPRKYRKYWMIAILALLMGVLAIAVADEALTTVVSNNTYLKTDGTGHMDGDLNLSGHNVLSPHFVWTTTTNNQHFGYVEMNNDVYLNDTGAFVSIGTEYNNIDFNNNSLNINSNSNITMNNNVDMNNNNLINCANCGTGTDNTKVNKSGDNMTGSLDMGMKNITNGTIYQGQQLVAINLNSNSAPFYFPNDAKAGLGTDYVGQFISEGNGATMVITAYGNDSIFEAPSFVGVRNRGNISYGYPLLLGDYLFSIGGRGWHTAGGTGTSSLSTSKVAFAFVASQNWTSTAMGTKITLGTTKNNTTTFSNAITINDDGNATLHKLAGIGNAYPVTSDATGKLQVNRSAGAGITMKSPSGNIFCATVSDAGAFTTTAGACP